MHFQHCSHFSEIKKIESLNPGESTRLQFNAILPAPIQSNDYLVAASLWSMDGLKYYDTKYEVVKILGTENLVTDSETSEETQSPQPIVQSTKPKANMQQFSSANNSTAGNPKITGLALLGSAKSIWSIVFSLLVIIGIWHFARRERI